MKPPCLSEEHAIVLSHHPLFRTCEVKRNKYTYFIRLSLRSGAVSAVSMRTRKRLLHVCVFERVVELL